MLSVSPPGSITAVEFLSNGLTVKEELVTSVNPIGSAPSEIVKVVAVFVVAPVKIKSFVTVPKPALIATSTGLPESVAPVAVMVASLTPSV